LRRELLQVHDLVDGPVLLQGEIEREVELTIRWQDKAAKATFKARRLADEAAYTHPDGLSLIFSDRRKRGDVWVHEFEIRVFQGERSIGEAKDILSFLRLLRPGAKLFVDDRLFISADTLGDSAFTLGSGVEALERIAEALNLDLKQFTLADFNAEEFGSSLGFLDLFVLEGIPIERFVRPFVLGPTAHKDPDDIPTNPVRIKVPIVLNLGTIGILLWVRARGEAYIADDTRWCGLRFIEQLTWASAIALAI
jgi:hypothetical protein